ncbi:hypothetical protein GA0115254_11155 [Streptomyces sp. Ncost-T10-10d]|nr:hypothetical protein GA0115254_11155 [Streptomyces sp. Ncost-T10-10d]
MLLAWYAWYRIKVFKLTDPVATPARPTGEQAPKRRYVGLMAPLRATLLETMTAQRLQTAVTSVTAPSRPKIVGSTTEHASS